ncbi:MAG: hypothetical protein V7756_07285 [Halopseudomonas sp.]|uniref:hypothetical protein n=1 Tax=Halopseudomonas sp. TaxID=2901191 RepID=UPI003002AC58
MNQLKLGDVRKLQIQDGDVLVVPAGVDPAAVQAFLKVLGELDPAPLGVTVAIGPIETISQAQMEAAGWYRK